MTFGGGMAMLPILQREVVENKHWATEEELTDYYAIGQCTPGIIAVNTATFIGQKYKGIAGGIVATLGVVFPSLVIISILAGLISWPGLILAAVLLALTNWVKPTKNLHPIVFIAASAVVGVVFRFAGV